MNIQKLYEELKQNCHNGNLILTYGVCNTIFEKLYFDVGELDINKCRIEKWNTYIQIVGNCLAPRVSKRYSFSVRITCRNENDTIKYTVELWNNFEGCLQDLLDKVDPTLTYSKDARKIEMGIVSGFQIARPVISYDSADNDYFPLKFYANAMEPQKSSWGNYADFVKNIHSVYGRMNQYGEFRLTVPVNYSILSDFESFETELLLFNGVPYDDLYYPYISEVGLQVQFIIPNIGLITFNLPLFSEDNHWTLHGDISEGIEIKDIVIFFLNAFGIGGNLSALQLPANTLLNQFRLYNIDILTKRENLSLTMQYLAMQFALSEPWKLPVPYITLERLDVGFEVSFSNGTKLSDGTELGDLLTASAGGTLSIELGKYKLFLTLEMDLPETNFMAQTRLEKSSNNDAPGIVDLAQTFDVTLPDELRKSTNLLGEITVYGSGTSRDFSIVADAYDIISFNVGKLEIKLDQLEAGASVSTATYSFYVQGIMGLKSGEKEFSLFLKASYNNPGWIFAGGLYHGTLDLVDLLAAMFGYTNVAPDFLGINLTELEVIYKTETKALTFTAAFYTGWHVTLLGKDLTLEAGFR